jgi:hypothetical protein
MDPKKLTCGQSAHGQESVLEDGGRLVGDSDKMEQKGHDPLRKRLDARAEFPGNALYKEVSDYPLIQ